MDRWWNCVRTVRQWCLLVLFWAMPVALFAQAGTGDIVGRVSDESGAVLPGAAVTLTHVGTNESRTQVSNESGDYVFNLLPIGRYTASIEMEGFTKQVVNVELSTGARVRVDIALHVGQMTDTVAVTARSEALQTDSASVGSLVTAKAVQDLPVNGRNFVQLVQLVPGATEDVPTSLTSGTRPDDRRQTSSISVNGALNNQNNHLIDGMDNNERAIGTIGVKPSIDAIAEVKVQTNLYNAEVGRTAGGVINIITKSGTNDLHGTGFVFARNGRFDARDYFATTKPELSQQQYGGSLGGPIKASKTFFFADYEGFRNRSGVVSVVSVPTMKMRQGDFSEIPQTIYDPMTFPRVPFAGNRIPANRLDPIALKYLSLYPEPTTPDLTNNWRGTVQRTQDSATADARLDHRFNDGNSIFGRYSYNDVDTLTPDSCPVNADGIYPGCATATGFPGLNTVRAHGLQANYVRVFSPTLISEVRAGYLKVGIRSNPGNFGRNVSQEFGIPGVNFDEQTSGLLRVEMEGYTGLGEAAYIPLHQIDDTWQVNGSITKNLGTHSIKAGAGYIDRRFVLAQSVQPRGIMNFNQRLTDAGLPGTGGNGMASFLLGVPSTVQRQHTLVYPHHQTIEPSAFVQDDWRATNWLTVNLGMRYDIFTPFTERDNQISNFDEQTARIVLAGVDGVSRTAGVKTDYSNLAPRLGFSATLPGRTVLRGGYGLSYYPAGFATSAMLKNQPFVSSYGPVESGGLAGGLPTLRLSDGMPLPEPSDYVNPRGSLAVTDFNFKSTRSQQFNIVAEKDFAGNVVSAGYIGVRSDRVQAYSQINLAPVGPGAVQQRRPFYDVLPGISQIQMSRTIYNQYYDALQLVFTRRYHAGLSFNSSYTLATNDMTGPAPWDAQTIERFAMENDVRHRWVFSGTYELPFGRSLTGAKRAFLSNWQVNAIASWQTGYPFNITNSPARSNTGGGDRPNLVGDPNQGGGEDINRWFNTGAFEAPPANTIGNRIVPRNSMQGPSIRRLDLSVFKDVPLSQGLRLQLRLEAYNITNTVNFGNPNGALGNPAFGRISTTIGTPRQMQFAAKLIF